MRLPITKAQLTGLSLMLGLCLATPVAYADGGGNDKANNSPTCPSGQVSRSGVFFSSASALLGKRVAR